MGSTLVNTNIYIYIYIKEDLQPRFKRGYRSAFKKKKIVFTSAEPIWWVIYLFFIIFFYLSLQPRFKRGYRSSFKIYIFGQTYSHVYECGYKLTLQPRFKYTAKTTYKRGYRFTYSRVLKMQLQVKSIATLLKNAVIDQIQPCFWKMRP